VSQPEPRQPWSARKKLVVWAAVAFLVLFGGFFAIGLTIGSH